MKLKSSVYVLAAAVVLFCGACNSGYGTAPATDSGTVKADGSNNGSGQGGSDRNPGGDNSNGTKSNTATDGLTKDTTRIPLKDNSVPRDSMARDSSPRVKKGKKP